MRKSQECKNGERGSEKKKNEILMGNVEVRRAGKGRQLWRCKPIKKEQSGQNGLEIGT